MGISISSSSITIDNTTVTFDDIYQYAVSNNATQYINKLGSSYEIKVDLLLINNATLSDVNVFVNVLGDLIQIDKTSTLSLGELRPNGSTLNGCTLNAPNIKLAYGFGNTTTTNSGNLFLYGSTVNIYGFWGFFSGDNHVEVIDCFIDGFGRIEGSDSILKNIIFKRAHGKYGILSPKGTLKTMENLSVYESEAFYDSYEKETVTCAVYCNPILAGDLEILYGSYDGYAELAYLESVTDGTRSTLTFKGSEIKNGYALYRESNNVDLYHQFRFNPIITKADGSAAVGISITIEDKNGNVVCNTTSDQSGMINEWVTYYEDVVSTGIDIKTPHKITMTDGTITSINTLYFNKNYEMFPYYFIDTPIGSGSGGDIDYDQIQTMLNTLKDDMCLCVGEVKDVVENSSENINQVLLTLGEEVNENQTIIEGKSGTKMFL